MQIDPPKFIDLYKKQVDVDWRIVFSQQSKEFRLHKLFLSACSDYFSAFLVSSGSCSEMNDQITKIDKYVKKRNVEVFQKFFIPYIYHSKVEIKDNNFIPVLQIASCWRFEKLLLQLSKYEITNQNVLLFIYHSQDRSGFFNTPNDFFDNLVKFAKENITSLRNRSMMANFLPNVFLEIVENNENTNLGGVIHSDSTRYINRNVKTLVEQREYFDRFMKLVKVNVNNVTALYEICKHHGNEKLMEEHARFISQHFLLINPSEYSIMDSSDLLRFLRHFQSQGSGELEQYNSYNKIYEIICSCVTSHQKKMEEEEEGLDMYNFPESKSIENHKVGKKIEEEEEEVEGENDDEEQQKRKSQSPKSIQEKKKESTNNVDIINELWNCLDFRYVNYKNVLDLLERPDISPNILKKASKEKISSLVNQTQSMFEEIKKNITLTKFVTIASNIKINGHELRKHLQWNQFGNSFINSNLTNKDEDAYVEVSFKTEVMPTRYYLRSSASKYTPRNWKLYGVKVDTSKSSKKGRFHLLSEHKDDLTIKDAQTIGVWEIQKTSNSFKTFRLQQTGENWGGDYDYFGIDGFKVEGSAINFSSFMGKYDGFHM